MERIKETDRRRNEEVEHAVNWSSRWQTKERGRISKNEFYTIDLKNESSGWRSTIPNQHFQTVLTKLPHGDSSRALKTKKTLGGRRDMNTKPGRYPTGTSGDVEAKVTISDVPLTCWLEAAPAPWRRPWCCWRWAGACVWVSGCERPDGEEEAVGAWRREMSAQTVLRREPSCATPLTWLSASPNLPV